MFRWTVKVDVGLRDIFKHAAGAVVGHELYTFQRNCYHSSYGNGSEIVALVFNTVSLRWKGLSGVKTGAAFFYFRSSPRRSGHSAVAIGRLVYVWGGPNPHSEVLHTFDVDADNWSKPEVSGAVPEGKSGHSACALGKAMFIYGGRRGMYVTNDMFKLDTDTMVWSLIDTRGTSPPVSRFSCTATTMGTKIFAFDIGYKEMRVFDFDTETNLWTSTPSVQKDEQLSDLSWPQRTFAYKGELYLAAGSDFWQRTSRERTSSYLWRFNPETLSWTKVEPKGNGPACSHDVRCCTMGDRVVFFDGHVQSPSELWILDLKPSLKTLCKEAFIQHGLEQSELPHDVRWELAAMTETDPEARVLPGPHSNGTARWVLLSSSS